MSEPSDGYLFQEGPEDADWIKTMYWDLPDNLPQLMPVLTASPDLRTQKAALSHTMALPSWEAAPPMLKAAAARFLAGETAIG